MDLKEMRAAELASAQAVVDGAKGRDLTDDETKTVEGHVTEVKTLDAKIAAAMKSGKLVETLGAMGRALDTQKNDDVEEAARTLGEHFVKWAGPRLKEIRGISGASVSAPEYTKLATDPQTIGAGFSPYLTQIDTTVIQGVRPRMVVADLLGSGTISGNAISYFVEAALEGAFTTVAEGAAKPQLHAVDPTVVTDSLKKIAGFVKFTDEMTEDLAFYVSEINGRLLYELARFEEQQLLNGNGVGTNVLGILGRAGLQTEVGATLADNPDALFRSLTKVSTGSGLDADGIVINPLDYQTLRLRKDANLQYYGGGFFSATYGVGTLTSQPPLWGLRTVVTPAITVGTVLIGAYSQAATVYRKGGVRVESTNSHASDFTSNLVTVRAEERLALAVRRPTAFVKMTMGTT